jgi:hypothetical protein
MTRHDFVLSDSDGLAAVGETFLGETDRPVRLA